VRSIYSFAIALCLVFAGARPSEASIRERDPQTAQLAAAPHAVITASLARRTGLDAGIRPLVFIAPTWTCDPSAPPRARFDLVDRAPRSLASTFVTTRSARGPPRSRS
jgi:hypothetical protein